MRRGPDEVGNVAPAPARRAGALRRRLAALALAGLAGGAGLLLWREAQALGPLDLAAAEVRSPIVLDREGRLLRPFATPDGRWRLPVEVADVDPRFLAMLKAYEDGRFERHPGVDPLALVRAALQVVRH